MLELYQIHLDADCSEELMSSLWLIYKDIPEYYAYEQFYDTNSKVLVGDSKSLEEMEDDIEDLSNDLYIQFTLEE